jgi:hypothetical protein
MVAVDLLDLTLDLLRAALRLGVLADRDTLRLVGAGLRASLTNLRCDGALTFGAGLGFGAVILPLP